jgi:TolA-binding protein
MRPAFVNSRASVSENDSRYQPLIEKQSAQLTQLKSQLQSLRTQYNDFKRDYQCQSLQLQRQLYSVQRRRGQLERRLQELQESAKNQEQEQMANEMIDQIWMILSSHRNHRPAPITPPPRFDVDPGSESEMHAMDFDTPTQYSLDPVPIEEQTPPASKASHRGAREGLLQGAFSQIGADTRRSVHVLRPGRPHHADDPRRVLACNACGQPARKPHGAAQVNSILKLGHFVNFREVKKTLLDSKMNAG